MKFKVGDRVRYRYVDGTVDGSIRGIVIEVQERDHLTVKWFAFDGDIDGSIYNYQASCLVLDENGIERAIKRL